MPHQKSLRLLPSETDVPFGLVMLDQRSRTLSEVAENYTDAVETTSLFTSWGWLSNAVCSFGPPDGRSVAAGDINGIYVSIHEFGSAGNAAGALDFSLTEQAAGTALQEVSAQPFGDYSRALFGPVDYGDEITLLVQRGTFLVRVSAASLEGDPTPVAASIVQSILARM